ncbi:twin-arginine translocase TatA/TatE family subunit [Sphingobium aquiterrae]|uniref:twin-arginine translocase TatA/TatE family subunit n=1 Tax=Sphingobium aquiterrae TaxID=2038656 RepID=UPI00301788E8
MGSFSLMHWMIVLLVVMLLFGGGRISGLMGDVAKGIKSFKKGMEDDDDVPPAKPASRIEGQRAPEQSATSGAATGKTTEDHRQG